MSKRNIIIAGNWKMNNGINEAKEFVLNLTEAVSLSGRVKAIICPQAPLLHTMVKYKNKNLLIGAQNMHYLDHGAYTGEISPALLSELGVTHVIIGHSERRQYYNETNQSVNLKLKTALDFHLTPIFCLGENLDQRERQETNAHLTTQLDEGLQGIAKDDVLNLQIAYEPIWAIGTGKTATNELANETISFIRQHLAALYGKEISEKIIILYGGSVSPKNLEGLLQQSDIDGALVGGASLTSDSFIKMLEIAKTIK